MDTDKKMKSFKVKTKDEVRRFRIPDTEDLYAVLAGTVITLFRTNSFTLWYLDDEGDRIVIGSASELAAAMDLMPNLVTLNVITEKEKEEMEAADGQRCGRGRFRGRGRGHAHGRGNGRGPGHGRDRGHGRGHGCGRGRGRGGGEGRINDRLVFITSNLEDIEARIASGEKDVMLLWKKRNLEEKKSFLTKRLDGSQKGGEDGHPECGGRFEMRCEMVNSKIQYLDELLQTKEGSQNELLLAKKQKLEKRKEFMVEKKAFMAQKKDGQQANLLWRLKTVEEKLDSLKARNGNDEKCAWKLQKLEQRKSFLQEMVHKKGTEQKGGVNDNEYC